ncbi:long-chain-fatty-acid--CoA ligase [Pseudemcibacter aquimaris]|uniref:long-chain-fatty-acid--CoA ligase n=1 Tax=Pseudemcibacter aquimaris TaxID=2857064 RepID=UPI002010FA9C|nr:long-chain fatty acid--CoA ligase [Pseudemcibacter aquimaris]MCC3861320.1 long-chain fatty acid--CoA ligase [Pseudemcibacter aquimaris]WDU58092.1 long-chain fatty acid--CoA ligase [Pseudemcibacter aquimaris]
MSDHPWLKSYPKHVKWDQKFTGKPLYSLIDETAPKVPNNIALDFLGKTCTYGDLQGKIEKCAKALQDMGVEKGIKVGLFLPNCPQFIVVFFAVAKIGGTIVNYSPLYSESELLYQVEDSETDIMVTLDLDALYAKMKRVVDQTRIKKLIVANFSETLPFPKNILFKLFKRSAIASVIKDETYVDYNALFENSGNSKDVEINPDDDVAVLQYTGGTTGVPKGAMLTHTNLYVNMRQLEVWPQMLEFGTENVAAFLPFFHIFALTVVLNMGLKVGARIVIVPKFELEDAVKLLTKENITLFSGVPTMYTALANHKDADKIGIGNIKMAMSGGAPLPVDLWNLYKDRFGLEITEGYGLTEASPVTHASPMGGGSIPGSIGFPLAATEVFIMDRENMGTPLPVGEVGEICVRGPQVMKGYWKRQDATDNVMIGDILRTGDVGKMDENGFTYILDRDKDLILVGGFNVFPRTIEEAINDHPSVEEVTVIGIPDDYLGETPKAFVKLKVTENPITEDELMAFIKPKIGKHERPSQIEFRDELPKTMIGKLSKKELVQEEKEKYEAAKAAK